MEIEVNGLLKSGETLVLTGLKSQLTSIKIFLQAVETGQSEECKQPSHWFPMNDQFVLAELQPSDKEWIEVSQKFAGTMGSTKIRSIKRIQNLKFWRDYNREKKDLIMSRKRSGLIEEIKEELLWHGTRNNDPKLIYQANEESFDLVYSNDGLWGRGLYFAVNAKYSAQDYAYSNPAQKTKLFILARVMVGDSITLNQNGSLRKPPFRKDTKHQITYDSVKGHTGGSDVYILYHMRRAYPEYLIEFESTSLVLLPK